MRAFGLAQSLVVTLAALALCSPAVAAPPTTNAGDSTSASSRTSSNIPVVTTKPGRNKITIKKHDIITYSPPAAQRKDEDYSKLGPGGTATPSCPFDSSGCPDADGYILVDGVRQMVPPATIVKNCPAICTKTRKGGTDGSAPAVCPSGYVQIGFYNVQDEWTKNTTPGQTVSANTKDPVEFMKYWKDPSKYNCTAEFIDYGDAVCLPYKGGRLASDNYTAMTDDILWRDQCQTSAPDERSCFGMKNDGMQPFVKAGVSFSPGAPSSVVTMAIAKLAGVDSVFDRIMGTHKKIPATWTAYTNRGPVAMSKSAEYEVTNLVPEYKYGFKTGATCNPTELTRPAHSEMATYIDEKCKKPAMTTSVCNRTDTCGEPDHYQQWVVPGGACSQLYIKVRIPVFALSCSFTPGAVKPLPGMDVPTSVICSRVQPIWHGDDVKPQISPAEYVNQQQQQGQAP